MFNISPDWIIGTLATLAAAFAFTRKISDPYCGQRWYLEAWYPLRSG